MKEDDKPIIGEENKTEDCDGETEDEKWEFYDLSIIQCHMQCSIQ